MEFDRILHGVPHFAMLSPEPSASRGWPAPELIRAPDFPGYSTGALGGTKSRKGGRAKHRSRSGLKEKPLGSFGIFLC